MCAKAGATANKPPGKRDAVKYVPNALTISRMVLCVPLLLVQPFSGWFFVLYGLCGATDVLDGILARRWNLASPSGAALDSAADTLFTAVLLLTLLPIISFPVWLLGWILIVFLLRMLALAVGYVRFRRLSFLHTYANKATGLLLFFFPVAYFWWGMPIPAVVVCVAATASALEEVLLQATARHLNRDAKGLFF